MTITRASELMVMNGFGPERYAKLAPLVTALPVGTDLNVCTAPGIVLDSLKENVREFSVSPEDLAKRRAERCFPDLKDMEGSIADTEKWNEIKNSLTESSNYFRSSVWVTIGTTQFTLYSLLIAVIRRVPSGRSCAASAASNTRGSMAETLVIRLRAARGRAGVVAHRRCQRCPFRPRPQRCGRGSAAAREWSPRACSWSPVPR